tara:strand:- start:22 stop:438 length:417 start_codon:yes stop_codon:yes gene_type:complete
MHENLDKEEEVKVSSDRSFGIVFTLVFLAMGVWVVSGGQSKGWLFFVSAALFLVVAIARPSILGPLNRAWAKLGLLLGQVFNPILLGVVFFLVVTPMAVIRKLLGKDSLHLKSKSNLESYWIDRSPAGPKFGSMTKQF